MFDLDVHMSVLDGSVGILPRRLMVADRDHFLARAVLIDMGLIESGVSEHGVAGSPPVHPGDPVETGGQGRPDTGRQGAAGPDAADTETGGPDARGD